MLQYSVYVAEGFCKNTYNSLKGIPDWRTEDPEGHAEKLPELAAGSQQFYIRNLYGNIEDTFNRPIESSPDGWIDVALRERAPSGGFFARLEPTGRTRRCLNLGSYNYLGFGGVNSYCTPMVEDALRDFPVSTGSSDAELGHSKLHKELEQRVAEFVGKPAAMVVGMGFATNSLVLPAIVGAGDLIISDEQNHKSIVEGARMSGAKIRSVRHNDHHHLEELLQDATLGDVRFGRVLVVVEGIYSMEGELCRLPQIVEVAKRYGAYVYLDEAHSIGAVGDSGRGVCQELGVDTSLVDVMMGTFTKSFGAAGGYVAGSRALVEELRRHSAGCTDAVSMPPAVCVQVKQALRVISGADGTDVGRQKIQQLRDNSLFFREGLKQLGLEVLGEHPSPIMPVMLYQPYKIGDFSRLAFEKGLAVVVVGAPAVPLYLARVRFCISAAHSRADLEAALASVASVADQLCLRFEKCPEPAWAPSGSLAQIAARRLAMQRASGEKAKARRDAALRALAELPAAPALGHGAEAGWFAEVQTGWREDGAREEMHGGAAGALVSVADYLGLRGDRALAEACVKTVQRVGCGSCSPRGFYGTFPEHVRLEHQIAQFLGVGEAVLYSFGACTISSVVPSLMNAGDVAVVDEAVGHGVLTGLRLSKVKVVFYKHCDAESAGLALEALEAEDGDTSAVLCARPRRRRRFLVTEAVFPSSGRLAPLPELVDLRARFKARLILEESHSFGVLGATGRGLTEHYRVPISKVDVVAASLEAAGASVGGFAAGAVGVVSYQRLMGSGYVFSAALPPYLATASSHALVRLEREPGRLLRVRESAQGLRAAIAHVPGLTTTASEDSPVLPITLACPSGDTLLDAGALDSIARRMQEMGWGLCVAHATNLTGVRRAVPLTPSLRVFASAAHTPETLLHFGQALEATTRAVLGPCPLSPSAMAGLSPEVVLPPATFHHASPASVGLRHRRGSGAEGGGEIGAEAAQCRASLEGFSTPTRANLPPLEEEPASKASGAEVALAGPAIGDPVSMSVPLLQLLMLLHSLARRYLIGQISTTERITPSLLRYLHAEPVAGESVAVSAAFLVVNLLASRKFYIVAGPALLWLWGTPLVNLLVVCYCFNCIVGCMLKSTLLTNVNGDTLRARERQLTGNRRKGKMHAWPSVAAINATTLPFLALRIHFGSEWIWEMQDPTNIVLSYAAAITWLVLVCVARMRAGDSPADIQGGVVVGAIVPRVVVPLSDSIMLWLQEGGWNAQLVALLVAGSFSALTLFPLPINASGDVFRDALSCYHRTAVLVTFMLSFVVGKLMLAADAVEAGSLGQGPGASGEAGATALAAPSTAPLAAARMLLGLTLALVAVELVSRTVRVCVQALLQAAGAKTACGKGIARNVRRAGIETVILSRAATFGLCISYICPTVFSAVGI